MHRVGLMVPASNTVMEPDLVSGLAGFATVHTARMWLDEPVSRKSEVKMLDEETLPAARMLSPIATDVTIFGCTSAGSIRGMTADATLREQVGELTRSPVIGVMDSIAWRLRRLSAHSISLLTPYPPAVTDAVADGLEDMGFRVASRYGMDVSHNRNVARIPPAAIVTAAEEASSTATQALVVACTNLRSYEAREAISARTGLAAITALSAVIDRTRDILTRETVRSAPTVQTSGGRHAP